MQKLSTTHPLHADPDHAGALPGSIGVERNEWYAEARRIDAMVVVTMTADNPHRALVELITSGDAIDRWFKDEVHALTGVTLTDLFSQVVLRQGVRH